MGEAPTISTHVLDTERGQPAAGIKVALHRVEGAAERPVGSGTTDADGRIRRLLNGALEPGEYRIEFAVDGPFFGHAALTFHVSDATRSYHVPLLLAPYSLTSYRGS
jgi:5-hydroxyisourate hydrolase